MGNAFHCAAVWRDFELACTGDCFGGLRNGGGGIGEVAEPCDGPADTPYA